MKIKKNRAVLDRALESILFVFFLFHSMRRWRESVELVSEVLNRPGINE